MEKNYDEEIPKDMQKFHHLSNQVGFSGKSLKNLKKHQSSQAMKTQTTKAINKSGSKSKQKKADNRNGSVSTSPLRANSKHIGHQPSTNFSSPLNKFNSKEPKKKTVPKYVKHETTISHHPRSKKSNVEESLHSSLVMTEALKTEKSEKHEKHEKNLRKSRSKEKETRRLSIEAVKFPDTFKIKQSSGLDLKLRESSKEAKEPKQSQLTQTFDPNKLKKSEKLSKTKRSQDIQYYIKEKRKKNYLEKTNKKLKEDLKEKERVYALDQLDKKRKVGKSKRKSRTKRVEIKEIPETKENKKSVKSTRIDTRNRRASNENYECPTNAKEFNFITSPVSKSSSQSPLSSGLKTEREEWVNPWECRYSGSNSEFVEEFKAKILKTQNKLSKIVSSEIGKYKLNVINSSDSDSSDFGRIVEIPMQSFQKSVSNSNKPSIPPLSLSLLKHESDYDSYSEDYEHFIIEKSQEPLNQSKKSGKSGKSGKSCESLQLKQQLQIKKTENNIQDKFVPYENHSSLKNSDSSSIEESKYDESSQSESSSEESENSEDYSESESEKNTTWMFEIRENSGLTDKMKKTLPSFKNLDLRNLELLEEKSEELSKNLENEEENQLISMKSPRKHLKAGTDASLIEKRIETNQESEKKDLMGLMKLPEGKKFECEDKKKINDLIEEKVIVVDLKTKEKGESPKDTVKSLANDGKRLANKNQELTQLKKIERDQEKLKKVEDQSKLKDFIDGTNHVSAVSSTSEDKKHEKPQNQVREKVNNQNEKEKNSKTIEAKNQVTSEITQAKRELRPTNVAAEIIKPEIHKPALQSTNPFEVKPKPDPPAKPSTNFPISSESKPEIPNKAPVKNENLLEKTSNILKKSPNREIIPEKLEKAKPVAPKQDEIPTKPETDKNLKRPQQVQTKNLIKPTKLHEEIQIKPITDDKFLLSSPSSSESIFTPIEQVKLTKIKANFIPDILSSTHAPNPAKPTSSTETTEKTSQSSPIQFKLANLAQPNSSPNKPFSEIQTSDPTDLKNDLNPSLTLSFEDPPNEKISESSQIFDILQTSIINPADLKSPEIQNSCNSSISFGSPKSDKAKVSPKTEFNHFDSKFKEIAVEKKEEKKKNFNSKFFENLADVSSDRTKKFNESTKNLIKNSLKIEKKEKIEVLLPEEGIELIGEAEKKKNEDLNVKLLIGSEDKDKDKVKVKEESLVKSLQTVTQESKTLKPQISLNSKKPCIAETLKFVNDEIIKKNEEEKISTASALINNSLGIFEEPTKELSSNSKPKTSFTSDLFKSYNPYLDSSSSSDINISNSSSPNYSPKSPKSNKSSLIPEDLSEDILALISSEIYTFLRMIPFKDQEKEVDSSLEYLIEYLNVMANELKENESEVLEAINTPVYQDPLSRLQTLQDESLGVLSKFPTLELILPPDLCSELKVKFESLEVPTRQIYLQMLFDCVNEALNYIRPFGVTGIPDPWSNHPRILFGEAELENVFNRILSFMVKWASCRAGAYPSYDASDEDKLASLREEKMSSLLCVDVKDEEDTWLHYEEEETQSKILTAGKVFDHLISEVLLILTNPI